MSIRIFGIFNIIFGLMMAFYSLLPFLLSVLSGWVTDRGINSLLDFFNLYILGRLAYILIFIYSFSLIKSGFFMLGKEPRDRELAIVSSLSIVLGVLLLVLSSLISAIILGRKGLNLSNPIAMVFIGFIFYAILLIFYLSIPSVKYKFADVNEKHSNLEKQTLAVLILLIFPLFLYIVGFIIILPKIISSL